MEEQQIEYNLNGFLSFWILQVISELGTAIGSWTIIFWLAIETKSAFILGVATFLTLGCFFAVIMFAGVYVDRWSRKKIMGIVDILQGFFTLLMIYLFYINAIQVWIVLIILAIRSTLQAFHTPALQSVIQVCVPPKQLTRVNSLTYISQSMQNIIGPIVGGILVGALLWPIDQILLFDALPYFPAALAILSIRVPSVKAQLVKKMSFWKEFSEGFTFLNEHRSLLSLLSSFATSNAIVGAAVGVLLPLLILNTYHASGTEYGLVSALQGVGTLLGVGLMFIWGGFKKNVIGVITALFALTLCTLLMPLPFIFNYSDWILIISLSYFIDGFSLPLANVSSQNIWQKVVPKEKYGRVFSVRMLMAQGLGVFSSLGIGIIAEYVGVPQTLFFAAFIELAILIYLWMFTSLPNVEKQLGIIKEED